MPAGRPSEYTQEVADIICERLADGESLRQICLDEDLPSRATIFRWLASHSVFSDQYARARELQAETLFDEMIHIADTPVIGQKSVSKATGLEITEADMIEHRRLQIDARKWVLGKLKPKKYGEKITQEHTGPNGGPIQLQAMTDDELAAIAAGSGS